MSYRILLVDDDSNVLESVVRLLHKTGLRARTALSADDAMKILRSEPIDLIVSDQSMGGMSGSELLRQVQLLFPDVARFVLTGHATVEMVVDMINRGVAERVYLKPTRGLELATGITEVLDRRAIVQKAVRALESIRSRKDGDSSERGGHEVVMEVPSCSWSTLVRKLETLSTGTDSGAGS